MSHRSHLRGSVAAILATALSLVHVTGEPVDFVRQVQPVFAQHCLKCHGPEKQKSSLRLDIRARALQGGDSQQPAIVPGDSQRSRIVQLISSPNDDERMPPKGPPLPPEQIALVRTWIDQGASWPDGIGPKEIEAKDHWAFQPIRNPNLPKVSRLDWEHNAIDRFVLARLESAGLAPAPEADRTTLIRRLHFTLTGLPPTPEETSAFVADDQPGAYERLVDRLLASPQYGERWARHWLDVVRFAESHGFEMNGERPNAWPYRDYVIRAFNEDKRYDRFVLEQLAGDALGVDEATGFLVAGAYDAVKSPDVNLTLQQRMDELHDMIATTSSTFLGLTVGCARCHDHKFDPIPQADYYAMQAVFAGVQHGERTLRPPDYEARMRQAQAEREAIACLDQELSAFVPIADPTNPGPRRPPVYPRLNVDRFPPVTAKAVRFVVLGTSSGEPCLDELEIFTDERPARNVALASAGATATASGTYAGSDFHKLEHINDGKFGNARSWISNEPGKGWVQIEFATPTRIERVVWARDREGKFNDRLATAYRIEVASAQGAWTLVASSEDRETYKPGVEPDLVGNGTEFGPREREQVQSLLERKKQHAQRLADLTRFPTLYAGRFEQPGPTYRLNRGEALQKREQVAPGAVRGLGPALSLSVDSPEQERRLRLAQWIVNPANPLTARVLVNRLWQHHFGQGLVSTPSDFGHMGGGPSHPELLDWLAAELIQSGWSIKHMQRLIVLSSTYRQASQGNPAGLAADSGARLLWRFPSQRIEAEALRDAILFVSGALDLRMGGRGFDLFEPNNNYVKVYNAKTSFGPAEWRRMVYQSKPRMRLDDTFGAFDCPDAGQSAPRRFSSTTPLQALNLLNSPFLLQQAELFAERLKKEMGPELGREVDRAFLLAFSRLPSTRERAAAVALASDQGMPVLCRALFNANEFVYVF